MKIGDRLRCNRSGVTEWFTEGNLYSIVGFDRDGDPLLIDNSGDTSGIGCPLDGGVWGFEEVQ